MSYSCCQYHNGNVWRCHTGNVCQRQAGNICQCLNRLGKIYPNIVQVILWGYVDQYRADITKQIVNAVVSVREVTFNEDEARSSLILRVESWQFVMSHPAECHFCINIVKKQRFRVVF